MEVRWLEDFCVLARTLHFSRAAEERNITQPTFSRRIKLLEEEMGTMLINRETMPLTLTPSGELFLATCVDITTQLKETKERCHNIVKAESEKLRFATTQTLYLSFYNDWVNNLNSDIDLKINLKSASWASKQLIKELEQQKCDLIICYWSPNIDFFDIIDGRDFDHITIAHEKLIPMSLVGDKGKAMYCLPGRNHIPYISYNDQTAMNKVISKFLARKQEPAQLLVVSESGQATSIKAMIEEGFGIGWLPERMIGPEKDNRLIPAGGENWEIPLEIRAYKARQNSHSQLKALWADIKKSMGNTAPTLLDSQSN
ncbi:MAG: LysR family transcriptional regulator [Oceanospirillaceae bacterium]|nr:LysR family transcriptional regulator [Oceanospirillaceae bacterium]